MRSSPGALRGLLRRVAVSPARSTRSGRVRRSQTALRPSPWQGIGPPQTGAAGSEGNAGGCGDQGGTAVGQTAVGRGAGVPGRSSLSLRRCPWPGQPRRPSEGPVRHGHEDLACRAGWPQQRMGSGLAGRPGSAGLADHDGCRAGGTRATACPWSGATGRQAAGGVQGRSPCASRKNGPRSGPAGRGPGPRRRARNRCLAGASALARCRARAVAERSRRACLGPSQTVLPGRAPAGPLLSV